MRRLVTQIEVQSSGYIDIVILFPPSRVPHRNDHLPYVHFENVR